MIAARKQNKPKARALSFLQNVTAEQLLQLGMMCDAADEELRLLDAY